METAYSTGGLQLGVRLEGKPESWLWTKGNEVKGNGGNLEDPGRESEVCFPRTPRNGDDRNFPIGSVTFWILKP